MTDCFAEVFVRCCPGRNDALKKAALISATVVCGFMGIFFSPLFLLLFAAFFFLDGYLFPRFRKEYEYSYVNGDIDIAAVYSKSSRKDLETIRVSGAECVAPSGSSRLETFGGTYRTVDYTSGDPSKGHTVIICGGNEKKRYLLELSEEILEDLGRRFPDRVWRT